VDDFYEDRYEVHAIPDQPTALNSNLPT